MNFKQILGIIGILLGIASMVVASRINERLDEARGEIGDAKQKVDTGKKLFSLSPATKEIGQGLTSGADKKIRNAEEEVAHYQQIANWCHAGGIALIVVGAASVLIFWKRSKKR